MSTIQLRTSIPGPKSRAFAARRDAAVPRGLSHATPVYVARCTRRMARRRGRQSLHRFRWWNRLPQRRTPQSNVSSQHSKRNFDEFLHTCVQVTPYESYVRLAERLNQLTPGKFPKKTLLVNTGAEAVENAVKIARAHTGRPGIIAFEDAFHGRTMMTLALTSKTHPYKAGFAPFPPMCIAFRTDIVIVVRIR